MGDGKDLGDCETRIANQAVNLVLWKGGSDITLSVQNQASSEGHRDSEVAYVRRQEYKMRMIIIYGGASGYKMIPGLATVIMVDAHKAQNHW